MKKYLLLILFLLSSHLNGATIYNGETAKFSASSTWDTNGSKIVQATAAPFSKPNHLRATLNVKNWWGAAAYIPANWGPVDLSKAGSLAFAIKAPVAKKVMVSLTDSNNKSSASVAATLYTCYTETSIPVSGFTGVDLTKVTAIIFSISDGTTASYLIDIDNITTSDIVTPTPPPPAPTPTPTPSVDNEAIRVKAAALVKEIRGNTNLLVGEGGIDAKALGLKPAAHYRYLVGYGSSGWRGWNSPDGEYANVVIAQAKELSAIPMFSYYQLAYEYEVKNYGVMTSSKLHQWLLDMRLLLQKVGAYGDYALIQIEPDFTGYLQQYAVTLKTPAANIPAAVKASDLPECTTVAETIGGMFDCVFKMARTLAPKARLGLHASGWGDWYDPMNPYNVVEKGTSVGKFLTTLGIVPDFITVDTCDRDAGFWEAQGRTNMYWDETNTVEPKYTTYFTWIKAISSAAGKPVLLWQTPFGVPSTVAGGTDGHYRDNRVKYLFSHMPEVAASGSFGIVFGAGAEKQTTPTTDGGQFKAALEKYNLAPLDLTKR